MLTLQTLSSVPAAATIHTAVLLRTCCSAAVGLQAWRELDSQQWQPCSWQQLDMEVSAAARRSRGTQEWQVLLREPVAHLQQLWHLRLQVRGLLFCTQQRQQQQLEPT